LKLTSPSVAKDGAGVQPLPQPGNHISEIAFISFLFLIIVLVLIFHILFEGHFVI
jgi:hypothetical protein